MNVIYDRTVAADIYTKFEKAPNASEGLLARNRAHRAWLQVLKRIQDFLLKLLPAAAKKLKKQQKNEEEEVMSVYDLLDVEEPDERHQSTSKQTPKAVPVQPPSPCNPPLSGPSEDEEKAMEVLMCLQDFYDIRMHVKKVWRRFYEGEISFTVAATLTEHAFCMIEDIATDLTNAHPDLTGWDDIAEFMSIEMTGAHNDIISFTTDLGSRLSSTNSQDLMNEAELFCAPAINTLEDFRLLTMSKQDPKFRFDARYTYKGHPFASVLYGVEPAVRALMLARKKQQKLFCLDSFTRCLSGIAGNALRMPIQAIAQCQIYFDVGDALGHQYGHGLTIMQESLATLSDSAESFVKAARVPPGAPKDFVKELQTFATRTANIAGLKLDAHFDSTPDSEKPSTLYSVLPILAGLAIHKYQIQGLDHFIDHANNDTSILCLAYLYRAARAAGLCKTEWADMETVITSQSTQSKYVREGSSLESWARQFDMAIGVPATTFARSKVRRPKLPTPAACIRKAKKLQPASTLMLVSQEVDGCLELETSSREGYYIKLHKISKRMQVMDNANERKVDYKPTELLTTLESCLVKDEFHLRFDWGKFLIACDLLKAVIIHNFQTKLDSLIGESNTYWYQVTDAIFWEAADSERRFGTMIAGPQTMLASIGSMIETMASNVSTTLTEEARVGSSGHIRDEDKPCNRWTYGTGNNDEPKAETEYSIHQSQCEEVIHRAMSVFEKLGDQGLSREARLAQLREWTNGELSRLDLKREAGEIIWDHSGLLIKLVYTPEEFLMHVLSIAVPITLQNPQADRGELMIAISNQEYARLKARDMMR